MDAYIQFSVKLYLSIIQPNLIDTKGIGAYNNMNPSPILITKYPCQLNCRHDVILLPFLPCIIV